MNNNKINLLRKRIKFKMKKQYNKLVFNPRNIILRKSNNLKKKLKLN